MRDELAEFAMVIAYSALLAHLNNARKIALSEF